TPEGTPEATPEGTPEATGEAPADNVDDLIYGSAYTAPTDGVSGGSVIISDWQPADQLNPYYSNAFKNTQVFASTMRGLYAISNDGKWIEDLGATFPTISNGRVRIDEEPGVAECPDFERLGAPEEETPGFEVDIDIRPGLMWSDGEPLTLRDLQYTFEWILDPEQTGLTGGTVGFDLIDSFELSEDELSATVHFCRGFAGFYGTLSEEILPEHYMSEIPVAEASERSYPVAPSTVDAPTSGPFQYASLAPDTIELTRNENYNSCLGQGCTPRPAYLERAVYRFYGGDTGKDAMIAAFLAGEVDVATDLLQGDYAAIQGVAPDVGIATIDDAWEYEHFDMNQLGNGPGQGHPALTNPDIRRAIALNINKQELYETVYPGTPMPETPPCAPSAPGLWYVADMENLTCIEYNQEEAIALLDEAGAEDTDGDGVREFEGEPLEFLHCHTGAAFRQNAGDYLASEMQEIGITLTNTAEATIFDGWNDVPADQICNLSRGNYDTTEFAWVQSFDIFGSFYYVYHSSQIPTEENGGNGANYVRLDEAEMDGALDQLYGATNQAEALELAQEIQRIHTDLQPEVVLYYRSGVRGLRPDLQGFARNPGTQSDMWNIEDWWLAEGG
ncbi:MAG TPA: ABC transporter substrate-binding protein, partial [Actinomycetota bacterium]|nr:ABC transporter substrate-binding protein [Actinomycetota bacterium]